MTRNLSRDAVFESSWAHFRLAEYEKALGNVSPSVEVCGAPTDAIPGTAAIASAHPEAETLAGDADAAEHQ